MIAAPKLISLGFLSIGIFVLLQVVLPMASFQLWALGQKYDNQILISPKEPNSTQVLGVSVQTKDNFPAFVSSLKRIIQPNYNQFTISIPKLKIEKEVVDVDSDDSAKTLTHLPGSSLPGEKGNVFISGHSAVSQLLNYKNAIFAKLPDLKKGDQIIVGAGGAKFLYQVSEIKIVDPSDLSVIQPPDDLGRYISLMTCVPPGLNFKRLIVLGKMI